MFKQDLFYMKYSMMNEFGQFTLQGYNELLMQIMEKHLEQLDSPRMAGDGITWVLLSMTFQVEGRIQFGDPLEAKIYETPCRRPLIREDIVFTCRGKTVMRAAAFMGLMKLGERRLLREELDEYCRDRIPEEPCMEAESRIIVEIDRDRARMTEFRILPSFIDPLGHCNNEHYYGMIYDSLTEEQQKMDGFRRMEISFLRELRKYEMVKIYCENMKDVCKVQGIREDGEISFMAKLYGFGSIQ